LQKLWQNPSYFEQYVQRLNEFRNNVANCECEVLKLTGQELVGKYAIHDFDIGKLLFVNNSEQSTERIENIMSSEYKVQLEMAAGQHILAMTSVADTDNGFDKLLYAVKKLNSNLVRSMSKKNTNFLDMSAGLIEMVLMPREAIGRPTEILPWKQAVGRIAGELVVDYPPGIALIMPGEKILKDMPQLREKIRVIM